MTDEMQPDQQPAVKADIRRLEAEIRRVAIVVARHEGRLDSIDQKLTKLDLLDDMKRTLDGLAAEVLSSRRERAVTDKTFSDQQAMLTDHELRLTRLERERKPS